MRTICDAVGHRRLHVGCALGGSLLATSEYAASPHRAWPLTSRRDSPPWLVPRILIGGDDQGAPSASRSALWPHGVSRGVNGVLIDADSIARVGLNGGRVWERDALRATLTGSNATSRSSLVLGASLSAKAPIAEGPVSLRLRVSRTLRALDLQRFDMLLLRVAVGDGASLEALHALAAEAEELVGLGLTQFWGLSSRMFDAEAGTPRVSDLLTAAGAARGVAARVRASLPRFAPLGNVEGWEGDAAGAAASAAREADAAADDATMDATRHHCVAIAYRTDILSVGESVGRVAETAARAGLAQIALKPLDVLPSQTTIDRALRNSEGFLSSREPMPFRCVSAPARLAAAHPARLLPKLEETHRFALHLEDEWFQGVGAAARVEAAPHADRLAALNALTPEDVGSAHALDGHSVRTCTESLLLWRHVRSRVILPAVRRAAAAAAGLAPAKEWAFAYRGAMEQHVAYLDDLVDIVHSQRADAISRVLVELFPGLDGMGVRDCASGRAPDLARLSLLLLLSPAGEVDAVATEAHEVFGLPSPMREHAAYESLAANADDAARKSRGLLTEADVSPGSLPRALLGKGALKVLADEGSPVMEKLVAIMYGLRAPLPPDAADKNAHGPWHWPKGCV